MKAFLYMTTFACCLLFTQYGYSQGASNGAQNVAPKAPAANSAPKAMKADPKAPGQYNDGRVQGQYNDGRAPVQGSDAQACPADHPCEDQPMGECWCLMVHYEPRYYTTQRCVEELIPCKKKCWRKVPQCYEVQRCRMVPQYYTETCTRYVDECYEVDDCKCCKKTVCDEHCEYVPCYYWKHVCENPCCPEKNK
jgi:hypothetical protein